MVLYPSVFAGGVLENGSNVLSGFLKVLKRLVPSGIKLAILGPVLPLGPSAGGGAQEHGERLRHP